MVQEHVDRLETSHIIMLLRDLTASSKCHGCHHVRSATAGSTELLYGMLRTITTSIILKSDLVRYLPVKKESALDPPQP